MRHLINDLKEKGGFTYSFNRGEHAVAGVSVSMAGSQQKYAKLPTEEDLWDYVTQWQSRLSWPGNHLGAWYNDADHYYYLDVSTVMNDLDKALKVGLDNQQEAVYDIGAGKEHRISDWLDSWPQIA